MTNEEEKKLAGELREALSKVLEQRRRKVGKPAPGGPEETTIGVYLPTECLLRAHALDLPPKIKNKVLSSILRAASNPGVDPHGEWGEVWGEMPNE